ncbi:MAG: complex I NDUFA9 subunit family protein [Chromatiales bacterium]|jgi:NADH dehydrogenase
MNVRSVCILGGSGFVGRHLVAKLAAHGIQCRVPTRHAQRHRQLAVNPGCRVYEADIFDKDQLVRLFDNCDAVINLVGILNERKKNDFRRVHVDLVDKISTACRQAGVKRLLHMSALNADAGSGGSLYLRTKGEGENRAHTGGKPDIAVTSFKPSVIYGADDSFINRFAGLLNIPGPMPLACPNTRFAPVYVEDVCNAMLNSINNRHTYGQRYELCGPEVYSLRDIVKYIAKQLDRKKTIINLPNALAKLQAAVLEHLPGKLFTMDNYLSLQLDSVCSRTNSNLQALGVKPTHMDTVVPVFLKHGNEKQRYNQLRTVSE